MGRRLAPERAVPSLNESPSEMEGKFSGGSFVFLTFIVPQ